MKLLVAVAVVTVLIVVTPVIAVVALLSAVAGGAAPEIPLCATDGNLAAVLATIRHLESRDNYRAVNAHASASGAYQIVDSTWNGYAGYPRAVQAPPTSRTKKPPNLSAPPSTSTRRPARTAADGSAPSTTRSPPYPSTGTGHAPSPPPSG